LIDAISCRKNEEPGSLIFWKKISHRSKFENVLMLNISYRKNFRRFLLFCDKLL